MTVRSIYNLALMETDTERAAHSLARSAGSFLARAAETAAHLRDNALCLGRISTADIERLDSVQWLALQACRSMIRFPVYGESMVQAALLSASDACYSAGNVLYRRRIASNVAPLETTQAGADRERAPHGLWPANNHNAYEGMLTTNGAWISGREANTFDR